VAFYYALKTVYPINHQIIVGVNRGVMNRVCSLEDIKSKAKQTIKANERIIMNCGGGINMFGLSKVDEMNEAVAGFIIKRTEVLNPLMATHEELSTLTELVKAVNGAPTLATTIGESIKPLERK